MKREDKISWQCQNTKINSSVRRASRTPPETPYICVKPPKLSTLALVPDELRCTA